MELFFIDTHERGFASLGFVSKNYSSIKTYEVKPGALMETLDKNFAKKNIAEAEGIILVQGPGSFSSIRAGVLIGNLLARVYQKPLYAVSVRESQSPSRLITRIQNAELASVKYADPVYDAEPNITMPKI
ncbi:hypothetical protein GF391_02345 [Candidatus Uhrbacteria bacterium]|nr:hypothetical protein [Candidatus Uhrbacteria bacterium]